MSKPLRPLSEQAGRGAQLSERVAARVREAIMVGDLTPREFVRTEKLALELGVSQTPVREALMTLASEGSVTWEPRRGFRVIPVTAQDVRDLFDVQAYVAGELAARAVDNLTDAEIAAIEAFQQELDIVGPDGDPREVDRLNHQVHRRINLAARSVRLANLLRSTVQHVPLSSYGAIDGWASASVHDHAPILEALRRRDADAIRVAMSAHIRNVGELLIAHLQREVGLR
ncbi:GntR family transcriptional regulator [Cumulibacter manganitolerans]|uniref:GntR family transcriptional regulator n=1 Tax=Cumulibacter manganitolerans TaxID=1884992 RepID=UPI001E562488|nr:GntR family transcriptional regulator [Cumulibacter manganitolerans]